MKYKPKNLLAWQMPHCYSGASWPDYYRSGCGQSRDSNPLERANFDAMLKALGGEQYHKTKTVQQRRVLTTDEEPSPLPLVMVVRETHWAVGWVEWIAIHKSAAKALQIADQIQARLENYPVVDEALFSEYETQEADETWRNCFRPKERIKYVREHRRQFEFRGFADLIGCIRGKYFAGDAAEFLS